MFYTNQNPKQQTLSLCFQAYAAHNHYSIQHSEVRKNNSSSVFTVNLFPFLMKSRDKCTSSSFFSQLAKLHQMSLQQQSLASIGQSATPMLSGMYVNCMGVHLEL